MELVKPRAILFDWDNTLVDTWPVIHQALAQTFEQYGMTPWTLDEVKARVARSMRDAFPDLFGDKWQEAGEVYKNNYRSIHQNMLKALPGAENILRMLADSNIFVGVVSNKTGPILRKEVPYLNWDAYFKVLVGSGDAAKDKPHADPIVFALKDTGIIPTSQNVWLVGDSIIDVECAHESGISAIAYGDLEVVKLANGALMAKDFGVAAHMKDHTEMALLLKKIL